jgi:hypothetical protein
VIYLPCDCLHALEQAHGVDSDASHVAVSQHLLTRFFNSDTRIHWKHVVHPVGGEIGKHLEIRACRASELARVAPVVEHALFPNVTNPHVEPSEEAVADCSNGNHRLIIAYGVLYEARAPAKELVVKHAVVLSARKEFLCDLPLHRPRRGVRAEGTVLILEADHGAGLAESS